MVEKLVRLGSSGMLISLYIVTWYDPIFVLSLC